MSAPRFITAGVDAQFGVWGVDGWYKAPTAAPEVKCRIVFRRPEVTGDFGGSQVILSGREAQVRTSEVAKPVRGGYVRLDGAVEKMAILSDPVHGPDDPYQLVWTMRVP